MFDGKWRAGVDLGTKPIGNRLGKAGISPDFLTTMGLVFAVACAVAIGSGRLRLGLALLIASAVPDLLDGAVARAHGRTSSRGAFFDSVVDRVTDSLILGGIAWHLSVTEGGLTPMVAFALLAVSSLVPYERAKAESLGYTAKGGIMERAERIIALGVALTFSFLMIPILWVLLVLTSITAVQRFLKVWNQASNRPTRIRMTTSARWEAWRTATAESWRMKKATSLSQTPAGGRARRRRQASGSRNRS